MALINRLAFIITADAKAALTEFDKVGEAAERDLGKAEQKIDKLGAGFRKAGAGMLAAGGLAAAGLWKAGSAASGFEQSAGGIESVFGDAASVITEFGETAAETAGLSKTEVNQMASVIGAGLKGMGFSAEDAATTVVELEKRAADMAATFGGTTQEAIESVASALRGERDPIERFGVSIKQADVNARILALGLDTSTAAAQKMSEATATLDLIMAQTSDAAGQFGRESDTLAGQQARLKAEMDNLMVAVGQGALPVMSSLAGAASDVLGVFGDLDPATQRMVGSIGAIGAGSSIALGGLSLLIGQVIKARENFAAAKDAVSGFAGRIKGNLVPSLLGGAGVVAALGLATFAVHSWIKAKEEAKQRTQQFVDAIKADSNALGANSDQVIRNRIEQSDLLDQLGDAGLTYQQLKDAIDDTDGSQGRMADTIKKLTEPSVRSLVVRSDDLIAKLREEGGARNNLIATLLEESDAGRETFKVLRDLFDARDKANELTQAAAAIGAEDAATKRDQAAATGEVTDATENATDAVRDYTDSLAASFDSTLALEDASFRARDAITDYGAKVKESGAKSDDAAKALNDAKQAALNLAGASLRAAEDQAKLSGEQLTAKRRADIQAESLSNLAATLAPGSPLRVYLEEYIGRLRNVPRSIKSTIKVTAEGLMYDKSGKLVGIQGAGGTILRHMGGPVPGSPSRAVPMIAHGGEFVLSADVVDAIKRGTPTQGRGGLPAPSGVALNVGTINMGSAGADEVARELSWLVRTGGVSARR